MYDAHEESYASIIQYISGEYQISHDQIMHTNSPNVFCTKLPNHWRANKGLPSPFKVFVLSDICDGTQVTVRAGNDENAYGECKNHTAAIRDKVAKFGDLRFLGRSGRG